MSSKATIPGLHFPWKIVLVCKEKVTKPICSGSHTASSQPSPECAEHHDRKSSPWVFQASIDPWIMDRELVTAMVSLCTERSISPWQQALSHTPCAGACWLWPSHTALWYLQPLQDCFPIGCFPIHRYRSYRTMLDIFLWRMFSNSSSSSDTAELLYSRATCVPRQCATPAWAVWVISHKMTS